MNVGDMVRNLRKKKGMSQKELAEKAGYTSASSVARIEAGRLDPPRSKVESLADALGVSPAEILCLGGQKEKPAEKNGGLDAELVDMLIQLSPDDVALVRAFLQGLTASRAKRPSPPGEESGP